MRDLTRQFRISEPLALKLKYCWALELEGTADSRSPRNAENEKERNNDAIV